MREKDSIPKFGLITNPSLNIISKIREIDRLGFDYVNPLYLTPLSVITLFFALLIILKMSCI